MEHKYALKFWMKHCLCIKTLDVLTLWNFWVYIWRFGIVWTCSNEYYGWIGINLCLLLPVPYTLKHLKHSSQFDWLEHVYLSVLQSRHYMQCVWNCIQFWVCCGVTISAVQVLGIFLMLPPVLMTGSVLWLVCLIVPLLSLSLVASSTDPQVMQRATGKNQCVVDMQASNCCSYVLVFLITSMQMLHTFPLMILLLTIVCAYRFLCLYYGAMVPSSCQLYS
jgi:hypothetical protein